MGYKKELKKILNKHLKNCGVKKGKRKDIIEHSKRVSKICKYIAEDLELPCDMRLLRASAMLHDIAKYDKYGNKQNNHNEKVKKAIRKYAGKRIDGIMVKDIAHIAKQHKGRFKPKRCENEAAVVAMADKVDRFNKYPYDVKGNIKALNKTLNKIREFSQK